MSNIARIISEAQLTNGGPVILYQPENEYTSVAESFSSAAETASVYKTVLER